MSSLAYLSIAVASISVTFTVLNLPTDVHGNKIWPSFITGVAVPSAITAKNSTQETKTNNVADDSKTKNVNFYDKKASNNVFEKEGKTLKTIIKLEGVAFKDKTTVLADSSFARLRVAVVALNKFSRFSILVAAHSDNVGNSDANKELSLEQAKVVKEYFINQGIKPSRLAAIGFGDEQPIADNSTEEGRKANRRVELRIY